MAEQPRPRRNARVQAVPPASLRILLSTACHPDRPGTSGQKEPFSVLHKASDSGGAELCKLRLGPLAQVIVSAQLETLLQVRLGRGAVAMGCRRQAPDAIGVTIFGIQLDCLASIRHGFGIIPLFIICSAAAFEFPLRSGAGRLQIYRLRETVYSQVIALLRQVRIAQRTITVTEWLAAEFDALIEVGDSRIIVLPQEVEEPPLAVVSSNALSRSKLDRRGVVRESLVIALGDEILVSPLGVAHATARRKLNEFVKVGDDLIMFAQMLVGLAAQELRDGVLGRERNCPVKVGDRLIVFPCTDVQSAPIQIIPNRVGFEGVHGTPVE